MYGSPVATVESTSDDPLASVSDPRLHRLFAYLEAKRGGREFAARHDIDPLDFAYILGNILLFDVLYEPLRFRYRLVGSVIPVIPVKTGYDMTGKYLHEHPRSAYRDYMLDRYAALIRSRRPASGNYDLFMECESKRYQYLRVPLSSDGRIIDMVIVAIILPPPAR
jgi:PAS domain